MPTSRARVRGTSTQSANGADAAAAMTAGAGRSRRRRTSGAATPAASAAAAPALMAVDRRTAGGSLTSPQANTESPGEARGAPLPTSAATTPERGSTSGCHCTPSTQRASGISIASTRSSSTLQPLATSPSPSRSTAWWWCDLVLCTSSPHARAASDPSASRTSWSASSNEPSRRRWSPWPTSSGRCWTSVPPNATSISCMPRQMPSTGRSRSTARRASGISAASRSGRVPVVQWCGSAP